MSDVSSRSGSSPRWTEALAPHGGSWMVLCRGDDALVVAPPAIALCGAEPPEQMRSWRLASWPLNADGWMLDIAAVEVTPVVVQTHEVLLLSEQLHGWVEGVMRLQLAQCVAFVAAHRGGMADEERSRGTAKQLNDLLSELAAAFPGEDWYEHSEPELPRVPETATGLLAAIDGGDCERTGTLCLGEPADVSPCCGLAIDDLVWGLQALRRNAARVLARHAPACSPMSSRLSETTQRLLADLLERTPAPDLAGTGQIAMSIYGQAPAARLDPALFHTTVLNTRYGTEGNRHLALALAAWTRSWPAGEPEGAGWRQPDLHVARCVEQAILEIHPTDRDASVLALVGHGAMGLNVQPSPPPGAVLDIPGWAALALSISGGSLMVVDARDNVGDNRLNQHLLYRCGRHPYRDFSALFVQDAIDRRNGHAVDALADEWTWLAPLSSGPHNTHDGRVKIFRGWVVDQRTNEQGRLVVFDSVDAASSCAVLPHGPDGDLWPHLDLEGSHPDVRRALTAIAGMRARVPAEPAPTLRPKAHVYAEHLRAARGGQPAPLAFAVAANVTTEHVES